MFRFLRILIGLFLIPLCVSLTWSTLEVIRRLLMTSDGFSPDLLWFLVGMGVWMILWCFFRRPFRLYVFGHEMTHALFGLLFLARVRNLRVTTRGGSVTLSKDNIIITLAPYFFPFYTVLVLLIHWIVGLFLSPVPCPAVWTFLVGLTWTFHLCFTIQSLAISQPDCKEYGYILSYTLIFLVNVASIGFFLVCVTDIPLGFYCRKLYYLTQYVYYMIYRYGVWAVDKFQAFRAS